MSKIIEYNFIETKERIKQNKNELNAMLLFQKLQITVLFT